MAKFLVFQASVFGIPDIVEATMSNNQCIALGAFFWLPVMTLTIKQCPIITVF